MYFFFIKIHKTGFLHRSIAKYLIHIILSFMFNLVHLTRFNSPIFPLNRLKFSFPLCSCLVFILFLLFLFAALSTELHAGNFSRTWKFIIEQVLLLLMWWGWLLVCVLLCLCLWVCLQWVLFCPKVQQVQSGGMIFVGICMSIWA